MESRVVHNHKNISNTKCIRRV